MAREVPTRSNQAIGVHCVNDLAGDTVCICGLGTNGRGVEMPLKDGIIEDWGRRGGISGVLG